MRNRRDVSDAGDLQTAVIERTHCRLAAGARPTDTHLAVLHAMLLRGIACLLGGNLCGEWRALARPAKAAATRCRPRQRVALAIGDRDDRVVEGCMDVRDRIEHVLASLLRLLGTAALSLRSRTAATGFLISHLGLNPFMPCQEVRSTSPPVCADPSGYVRWYVCAGRGPAVRAGDGYPGRNRDPSSA